MIGELDQTRLVKVSAGDDLVTQGLGAEGVVVAIPIARAPYPAVLDGSRVQVSKRSVMTCSVSRAR